MKVALYIIIPVISIIGTTYCQNENDSSKKSNDEFIDATNVRVNPNKDSIEKESFPSVIHCETLGTTYEMFFYNSTFMNCAPAQWNCEYNDPILLPNKTITNCYNRRNVNVECLYGGFRPMSKCRHGHTKCGTNFFNCKEKKPRKNVEYSDAFLIKLRKAVMEKNISVDVGLLEQILEADNRRISRNISENFYLEDIDVEDEDEVTQGGKENSTTTLVPTTTTIIETTKLSTTPIDDLKKKIIINDATISEEKMNLNFDNYSKVEIKKNHNDKKQIETSNIIMNLGNILNNPVESILIIILCIIINILLIFVCCKIYRKATFVYEVSEQQKLMSTNETTTTFKNESFNLDNHK